MVGTLIGTSPQRSGRLYLFQQYDIGDYRADFAFFCTDKTVGTEGCRVILRGVVETDGHDFHERTKEQALKDKKRDRKMAIAGWEVLRFTGSDVYRDANECLDDVFSLIEAKVPTSVESA